MRLLASLRHLPSLHLWPKHRRAVLTWLRILALVLYCACLPNAHAEIAPEDTPLRLSGVAWAKATYAPDDSSMRIPALDLYRLQLQGISSIHDGWEGLFTLNASTESANLSSYSTRGGLYIHHALVRRRLQSGMGLSIGRMSHPFLGPIYRSHGTRFLAKQLAHAAGYLSSTPIGLSIQKKWGLVDIGATLHQATPTTGRRTQHLFGTSLHANIDFNAQWSLRILQDYRQQNHHLNAPDASESVVATTLTHQSDAVCISLEGAGRVTLDDIRTIELGYGVFGTIDLYSGFSVFGRIASGNDAFKESLNADILWSVGPVVDLGDAVLAGIMVDVRQTEATDLTISLAVAKKF